MRLTIVSKPLEWFTFNNIRQCFEQDALIALGKSLRRRQWHPVVARSDGSVVDGERRVRAAKLEGLDSLDTLVIDDKLTQSDIRLAQAATAMHRADLTAGEKYELCHELLQLRPDWLEKDLAEHLCISESMVTRIMAASKTVPEVRQALKEGKLGTTDVYAISKAPEADQPALLAQKLNGASRDDLERSVRERKKPTAKTDGGAIGRPPRKFTVPLPAGVSIAVAGKQLDVATLIAGLMTLLKSLRKFDGKGWDLRTIEQVLRDEASRPPDEGQAA